MFETHKDILDRAFSSQIADWETLSPLDPMKTIAESLASALESIENEQTRQLETVLDSIPNLIGFNQRAAVPARAVFRVIPAKNAQTKQELRAGTEFLMNGGDTYAVLRDKMQVYPATLAKEERGPKSISFEFAVRGELPELKLFYVAQPSSKKTPLLDLKLEVKAGTTKPPLFLDDVQFLDETLGGTASGFWILRPLAGQSAVLCTANSTVRLELIFENELPSGTFHFNGSYFDLVSIQTGSDLGSLAGDAWEECLLSDRVLAPPASLECVLADGTSARMDLVTLDPLKARAENPDFFRNRYLYCAARHSLVFPAAHTLRGSLNGRIQLFAARAIQVSENPALGKATLHSESQAGIDRIEPAGAMLAAVLRETRANFLARFHAWVRNSLLLPTTAGAAYLSELSENVLGLDARIRSVEIRHNAEEKVLTFYVLYHGETDGSAIAAPPADLLSKLSDRIGRIVPLDYRWQIERFSEVRVELLAELTTTLPDGAALIPEAELEKAFTVAIQKSVQHETFAAGTPIGRERLAERIARRVQHPALQNDVSVHIGLKSLADGVSLGALSRTPGTVLRFSVQSKTVQMSVPSEAYETQVAQ